MARIRTGEDALRLVSAVRVGSPRTASQLIRVDRARPGRMRSPKSGPSTLGSREGGRGMSSGRSAMADRAGPLASISRGIPHSARAAREVTCVTMRCRCGVNRWQGACRRSVGETRCELGARADQWAATQAPSMLRKSDGEAAESVDGPGDGLRAETDGAIVTAGAAVGELRRSAKS